MPRIIRNLSYILCLSVKDTEELAHSILIRSSNKNLNFHLVHAHLVLERNTIVS